MKPAPVIVLAAALLGALAAFAQPVTSPDGRLAVEFRLNEQQAPVYQVKLEGRVVLAESKLGLVRDDADFTRGLKPFGTSGIEVAEDYEILTAKRRHIAYRANQRTFRLSTHLTVILSRAKDPSGHPSRVPCINPLGPSHGSE